ncbi:hypothetical protein VE04_00672 [Pseudogymnoascus sp. 24MN13]|nr:hypothetical protein VE04_00672 [Pseudogymnoascus sp. 24MN13]
MSTTLGAFIAGGVAACGAVTATHPFETVKIRMQLQGELQGKSQQPKLYKGPIHGVTVIVRNEGLRGIYRGIGAAYIYQVLLNGCRLGFYEPLRATATKVVYGDSTVQSLGVNVFSGASSGILGAAAGSPFFLIKTRLQSFSPMRPVGTQHKYKNALDGFRSIYGTEGLKGLYRGVGAATVRTRLWQLRAAADILLREAEVNTIMSRMYNQNGNLYKGVYDCLSKTVRTEGLLAIYKGYLPHLARILPHTILTLSFAEQTNKWMMKLEKKILPAGAI